MTTVSQHKPAPELDDARADRLTFFWIAGFFTAFYVVNILSLITERSRSESAGDPFMFSIYDGTSIVVILALFPLMRLRKGPLIDRH